MSAIATPAGGYWPPQLVLAPASHEAEDRNNSAAAPRPMPCYSLLSDDEDALDIGCVSPDDGPLQPCLGCDSPGCCSCPSNGIGKRIQDPFINRRDSGNRACGAPAHRQDEAFGGGCDAVSQPSQGLGPASGLPAAGALLLAAQPQVPGSSAAAALVCSTSKFPPSARSARQAMPGTSRMLHRDDSAREARPAARGFGASCGGGACRSRGSTLPHAAPTLPDRAAVGQDAEGCPRMDGESPCAPPPARRPPSVAVSRSSSGRLSAAFESGLLPAGCGAGDALAARPPLCGSGWRLVRSESQHSAGVPQNASGLLHRAASSDGGSHIVIANAEAPSSAGGNPHGALCLDGETLCILRCANYAAGIGSQAFFLSGPPKACTPGSAARRPLMKRHLSLRRSRRRNGAVADISAPRQRHSCNGAGACGPGHAGASHRRRAARP